MRNTKSIISISLLNLFGIFGILDLFLFLERSFSFFPFYPILGSIASLIALIWGVKIKSKILEPLLKKVLTINIVTSILIFIASFLYFAFMFYVLFVLKASPL